MPLQTMLSAVHPRGFPLRFQIEVRLRELLENLLDGFVSVHVLAHRDQVVQQRPTLLVNSVPLWLDAELSSIIRRGAANLET